MFTEAIGTTRLLKEKVDIMGVGIHPFTLEEAMAVIAGWVSQKEHLPVGAHEGAGRLRQVITMNPEMLYGAQHDAALRALLNSGDLVVPDGHGILWAGGRLGCYFPERVTGIDLIHSLAARAVDSGWRLYLLGGAPGVAEAAVANLQLQHPGLKVVGGSHGYFSREELPVLRERIQAAGPDLLLVGMGFPRQEYFIRDACKNMGSLVAIGVGGSFDVLSGRLRRSPVWIQRLHLEWLFRVFQEPARWRRLLVLPLFMRMVLAEARGRKPEMGKR